MAASLVDQGCRAMPVKMIPSDSSDAAENLLNGTYDAVLVLGEQLPANLKSEKFASMKAVSSIGTPVRVFHFVMLKGDASMTSSASFQDTVGRSSSIRVVASNLSR